MEVKPKASPIEAVKQIVVFSKNVGKPGVKKELAIGDVMRRKLDDPNFMIPLRIDDIAFGDAPSELIRDQILDGHPNWHDALRTSLKRLRRRVFQRTQRRMPQRYAPSSRHARKDGVSSWTGKSTPSRTGFRSRLRRASDTTGLKVYRSR